MILIDSRTGSKELHPIIRGIGVPCELSSLEFGDACFEGNGPKGKVLVGFERKTISDLLQCIDDARYAGHQRPGMMQMYDKSFLILEGQWKCHEPSGILMQRYQNGWFELKYRSQKVMYAKLYRFLLSVSLTGVIITQSIDQFGTAFNICQAFHYFSKKWDDHTSMRQVQKLNMPSLAGKPPLVRRWAEEIEGVGVKFGEQAQAIFKTPIELAHGSETDWLKIPKIGVPTAQKIIREIHGNK